MSASTEAPSPSSTAGHTPTHEITIRSKGSMETRRRELRRRSRLENTVAVGTPILLFILWELLVARGIVDGLIYPPPTKIAAAGWELIQRGELQSQTWTTFYRVIFGYGMGVVSGYLLGVVMGSVRFIRRALEPMLSAVYVVPKLALLPIFLTIFGFGDAPLIVMVAVTVFFYVWIDTMEGILSVPKGFHEAAESLGVNRLQLFRHVLLPATLPKFFVTLRLTMGLAVLVIVAAEFVVGQDGLGYLIFHSRELFLLDRTYVGIVAVALFGVTLQGIVTWIGSKFTPWSDKHANADVL